MKRHHRIVLALLAGAAVLLGSAACAEIADPDSMGLYYDEGNSDGYKFDHCIDPGASDEFISNNSVVWLPASVRTWNIAPDGTGDTKTPITVAAKPEPNQPSGVQVNVWTQTNLMLNTSCEGGASSPIVQWWERFGRHYQADTLPGWKDMLQNTVVTALETATRNTIRNYEADPLVAGTNLPEVQDAIAAAFQTELKRTTGADFFCGPTFDRTKPNVCPPVETIVKDVDFTDAGIQSARNAKQKAVENAAAQVAEAQGKVDSAAKEASLYKNPAWVQLEMAKTQLAEVQACAANPNCTVVVGSSGSLNISSK